MIDLQTAVRSQKTQGQPVTPPEGPTPAEKLLEERRDFYRALVARVLPEGELKDRDKPRKELAGISLNEALAMYAAMRTSREIDMMMQLLQRTGNLWFSIAGAGKEVINAAFAAHMRPRRLQAALLSRSDACSVGRYLSARHFEAERSFSLRPAVGRAADVVPLRFG